MIISGQKQHPTERIRPKQVAVPKHVPRTINPRPLPVPHRKNAIVCVLAEQAGLLGTVDRGRREIFVHRGMKVNV